MLLSVAIVIFIVISSVILVDYFSEPKISANNIHTSVVESGNYLSMGTNPFYVANYSSANTVVRQNNFPASYLNLSIFNINAFEEGPTVNVHWSEIILNVSVMGHFAPDLRIPSIGFSVNDFGGQNQGNVIFETRSLNEAFNISAYPYLYNVYFHAFSGPGSYTINLTTQHQRLYLPPFIASHGAYNFGFIATFHIRINTVNTTLLNHDFNFIASVHGLSEPVTSQFTFIMNQSSG